MRTTRAPMAVVGESAYGAGPKQKSENGLTILLRSEVDAVEPELPPPPPPPPDAPTPAPELPAVVAAAEPCWG